MTIEVTLAAPFRFRAFIGISCRLLFYPLPTDQSFLPVYKVLALLMNKIFWSEAAFVTVSK